MTATQVLKLHNELMCCDESFLCLTLTNFLCHAILNRFTLTFYRITFASCLSLISPRYARNMSTMDSRADSSKVQYSKRAFTWTFAYLDRLLSKAPSGKMMEALKASGRSADITFMKNHSDAAMGRLLLASFPSLMGINLKRWVINRP